MGVKQVWTGQRLSIGWLDDLHIKGSVRELKDLIRQLFVLLSLS